MTEELPINVMDLIIKHAKALKEDEISNQKFHIKLLESLIDVSNEIMRTK